MNRFLGGLCVFLGMSTAFGADVPSTTYAQVLVTDMAKRHPEVATLSFQVAPPKGNSVVIASTDRSEVGRPSDAAGIAVTKTGRTTSAVNKTGDQFEVLLALRDVSGDIVGGLSVTYPYHAGIDAAALEGSATKIRDVLHRHIAHAANLSEPYPYQPERQHDMPSNTYGQQLADEVLEKYPDVEVFMLHATPEGSAYNVVAGSNIGRIGERADNDDMRVEFTGEPNLEVNTHGNRFESELRLHDRAGKTIGAVGVVFAYKKGDDKEVLHRRAMQIVAGVEKKIPDSNSLFERL